MIKVLDKTFAILEEIVCAVPHPLGPLELSKRLCLNRTTCSRILRMLLESGYIVQVSRQAGYTAGPRIRTLCNLADFESELMKAAVPVIDHAAEVLNECVLLSQVWNGERYVLYMANRNPRRNMRPHHLCYKDIYNTATGVLEMAYREPEEALRIYDDMPGSCRNWLLPEFVRRSSVPQALMKIRKNGFYHSSRKDLGIFAFPVFSGGRYLAALGCSIDISEYTGKRIPFYIRAGKKTADEITCALTATDYVG